MKKIHILHENPEWLIPLREALEEQELPYREWLLDEGTVPFHTRLPPLGVSPCSRRRNRWTHPVHPQSWWRTLHLRHQHQLQFPSRAGRSTQHHRHAAARPRTRPRLSSPQENTTSGSDHGGC